jgi:hypothetical protein
MIPLSADPIESLTPERLSSWLSASIGEVSIASMTTKAVGTGQMASSYRLDLTYADRRPADAPDSVILKVSSQDESSRQMAAAASAYLREVRFYQNLAAVAGARVPRCYHADISSSAMEFRSRNGGTWGQPEHRPIGRMFCRSGRACGGAGRDVARLDLGSSNGRSSGLAAG